MRNRSSTIILLDGKVAVIKRTRSGKVYYVFPGGGIEENETPEEAAIRETHEELGVTVEIDRLLHTFPYNGFQYYFLATMKAGEFGTGKGEEYRHFVLPSRSESGTQPGRQVLLYERRCGEIRRR